MLDEVNFVKELIDEDDLIWNININPIVGHDSLIWHFNTNGCFTVQSY